MEIRSTEVDGDAKNRVEKCKSRLRSTNGDWKAPISEDEYWMSIGRKQSSTLELMRVVAFTVNNIPSKV
jgi:hypothetical protein